MSQAEAALAVGVHRQTVNIWLKRYRAQGEDGVLDGRRVSPRRGKGLLTADEAGKVRGWIVDKTPGSAEAAVRLVDQPGGTGPDRAALFQAARPVDGSTLPAALGDDAAKAAGAGQGALAGCHQGLVGDHYPTIAKRAKAERAVIYWGDETGISNQDQIGRCYAPRGRTPVVTENRQADLPEHDLGGQQSWPDALHALRRGAERQPLHRLPAPADQGCRAEGRA